MCRLVCGLLLSCSRRTWFIFLFGQSLQIRCFSFWNVCMYCCELIVTPLSKNSTNKIPLLSQACLYPKKSVPLIFFLCCDNWWCDSGDFLFVSGSYWWTHVPSLVIILDRKASAFFSPRCWSFAQMFIWAVLSIFDIHVAPTFL